MSRTLTGLRYRLRPHPGQERILARSAGACRWLWNWALAYREDLWLAARSAGARGFRGSTGYVHLSSLLPGLKERYPWLSEAPHHALQATDPAGPGQGLLLVLCREIRLPQVPPQGGARLDPVPGPQAVRRRRGLGEDSQAWMDEVPALSARDRQGAQHNAFQRGSPLGRKLLRRGTVQPAQPGTSRGGARPGCRPIGYDI